MDIRKWMGPALVAAGLTVMAFASAAPAARPVKVLPLGDSLTNGVGSSDASAYRMRVKEVFGDAIDFIGRRNDGPFADNQDEGWGTYTIDKLRLEIVPSIAQATGFGDVVLLMAGTNDMWWANQGTIEEQAAQAITDTDELLRSIFWMAGGQTKVLVSSIPTIHDWHNGIWFPEVDLFNAQLPALTAQFRSEGYDVRFVDAGAPLDMYNEFYDGVHPNDAGYRHMAEGWIAGLSAVVPEPATLSVGALLLPLMLRRRS